MKTEKNRQYQNEVGRDKETRFVAEQYISTGYPLHFHRNIEIYGVISGRVAVKIAGECKTLENGQFAIINGVESHSCEIENEAEVMYFHIGTCYMRNFLLLYPNKKLPHWLTDKEYNRKIYEFIKNEVINNGNQLSELKKTSIAGYVIADIIEHYGTVERSGNIASDNNLIEQIVEYIYDHYNENITLQVLSEKFYISPKALSKKLANVIDVDFRIFVNDIRTQKAVEMLNDPNNNHIPLNDIIGKCGFTNINTFYRSYNRNFKFREL